MTHGNFCYLKYPILKMTSERKVENKNVISNINHILGPKKILLLFSDQKKRAFFSLEVKKRLLRM